MIRPPHPFARFIQILGRGKTLSRSLTIEEAQEAMAMILAGDVLPEQLGAFLMLLRMKEESPGEIAGFVHAARAAMTLPSPMPKADVDWSSYAGKRRQLPWYLLAALVLAHNGYSVFMHGQDGHTAGRVYTGEVLARFGIPVAQSLKTQPHTWSAGTLRTCRWGRSTPHFRGCSDCGPSSGCARLSTRFRGC